MEPNWANLDALPLSLILDKLVERIDHVWFGVVCKNWRLVAKLNHQDHHFRTNVFPMLMIPSKRGWYSIRARRMYLFQSDMPYKKRYCGSSHGWLAITDANHVITLFNPFKNVAPIPLPPLWAFDQSDTHKVTLSADPITSMNDYVVVAIYSQRCCIAFMKAGQDFWTYVHTHSQCSLYTDAIFYKGLVYVAKRLNEIVSFNPCYSGDASGGNEIIPNVVSLESFGDEVTTHSVKVYLVKSLEGDLWLVRRFFTPQYHVGHVFHYSTKGFHVYKMDLDAQSGNLVPMLKLESLGDNVLFIGGGCDSISVSASYFSSCLQKDSIYYCNDYNDRARGSYVHGPFDLGVYNVKDGTFDEQGFPYHPSIKRMLPSLWVLPPFQWD